MNRIKKYLFYFLLLLIFAGCSNSTRKTDLQPSDNKNDTLQLSLTDSLSMDLRDRLNNIQLLYNEGLKCVQRGDTVGAEIYFANSLEIISDFTQDDRDEIQDNPLYATILKSIDTDYKAIFGQDEEDADRDRVMEEIGVVEDQIEAMPDSLAKFEDAVIDSSAILPLVINKRVSAAMSYFQTRGRGVFNRWLDRSGSYKALYTEILREEGVPEEFFYLAMVESGFINYAYSYARAAGPWQFMAGTGAMYGLRNSWWFDERRDPLKSTRAAAKHLRWLYDYFEGDWVLAMAGYNVNPAKVKKRIRIQETRDFWKLNRLPKQTLNYVPTFMAAAIMAKEPEKYGFYPNYKEPYSVDTVIVHEAIDLANVAEWTDTTYKAIRDINPAILRWCSPPGVKNFTINIPIGTRDKFYEGLNKIPENQKVSYVRYKIKEGDALGLIAQKYGVTTSIIKKQNRMRSNTIYAGKYLIIPVPKNKQAYYATKYSRSTSPKKKYATPKSIPGRKKVYYTVKSGDTVGQIAEDYHIRASEIRKWNRISSRSVIFPGQKLVIFTPTLDAEDSIPMPRNRQTEMTLKPGERFYIVKSGDTLWRIAQKHNTTIEKIQDRNNITSNIKPGERIIIDQ